jgi:OOP family OmpA-OmpF porin
MEWRGWLGAALIAVILFAVGERASAQPIEGLYVSSEAGVNLLMNQPIPPAPALGAVGGGNLQYNAGTAFQGAIGYGLGHGWRIEVEGDEMENTLSARAGALYPSTVKGATQTYGAMVNALFDLDIGSRYVFPYFGFGIGYQWTVFHNLRVDTPALGTTLGLSGEGSNPAGQGIVGLSFPVPGLVGLSITTEYRFLGMIGPESASAEITRGGSGPQARGYQEISDTLNQTFLLGIRYAFSVKPPASLGTSAGGAP